MIEGILIGLTTALTFQNILMVMVGCFFGTIIGMLPGLGPMTAIALMIPITYGFDPATGLILMAGVYYGAVFGGSTSSILLNVNLVISDKLSWPTDANINPSTTIIIAFKNCPLDEKAAIAVKPKIIKAK